MMTTRRLLPRSGRRLLAQAGFSLVEMMVVLFIIGLLAGVVVVTLPGAQAGLTDEAQRFASRAAAARDNAVLESRPMAMVVNDKGYYFEERRDGRWQGFDRPPFGLQGWKDGTTARVAGLAKPAQADAKSDDAPPSGSNRIIFDSVGLASEDVALTLSRDGASAAVRIDRNGGVRLGE